MPRLTEYEIERLQNIERNQALLKKLGIFKAEVAPSKAKEEAKTKEAAKENSRIQSTQKKRARPSTTVIAPRRKSARLSASGPGSDAATSPSMSSDPIDFLGHQSRRSPRKPVVALKRVSPPPIPENEEGEHEEEFDPDYRAPLPTRDADRTIRFSDAPHFTPNMTPEEVMRAGSFGGTAFRRHYSSVTKQTLPESDYTEFPESWYANLDINTYLTSEEYNPLVNRYRVKAGQTLSDWEKAGWVHSQDPRGWFQWYARFYLGRRTADDARQIKRWLGVCGSSGRFKRSLVKKIVEKGASWDDEIVSPILRQTLQHWAYRLTETDYNAYL
ncbi:uncharacterized protein FOMMEDRAFT_160606 [Fomitiporia mediterranea MF3/22]|uniref:uncharacterized protein n=1 Tax=Fomitiporia mediterranea (strain MF3/22) TaxID=694068 RepID=UPI0004407619|nr:uncharacterized protein FOMMEDRAFT_160606 [Fomitiporia mediterranea MF3/22]EJC99539.1 hypothetical protein FOMMEDRAFT_160606 [Fomitiporia mediterranea MF3/22]